MALAFISCGSVNNNQGSGLTPPPPNQATIKLDGNPEVNYIFAPATSYGTNLSDPLNLSIVYVESISAPITKKVTLKMDGSHTGTQNTNGQSVEISYFDTVDTFKTKLVCGITITSPYTGKNNSYFNGDVDKCLITTGGLDLVGNNYHTLSIKFNKSEG